MNQSVTVNEMLQTALHAEKVGVTVDWRDMCFKVANTATNVIEALENRIAQSEDNGGDGEAPQQET